MVKAIDKRTTVPLEEPNYSRHSSNADSLLRKGNRPRPRESRPDIRVSNNCACVLVPTRKKRQAGRRAARSRPHTYARGAGRTCVRVGPILTIYSRVVTRRRTTRVRTAISRLLASPPRGYALAGERATTDREEQRVQATLPLSRRANIMRRIARVDFRCRSFRRDREFDE